MNQPLRVTEKIGDLKTASSEADFYNTLLRLVVHEIATPMNVSMVVLKRLQKDLGKFDLNSDLEKLGKANFSIIAILEQVRHFLSITSGKIEISLADCNLHELLIAAIEMQDEVARKKNLNIRLNAVSDDIKIHVEPNFFKSVILGNLLSNAIKFSHPGGQIDLTYGLCSETQAFVRVVDYGLGIPPELLPRLFDPAFPTHREGTGGEGGVGFGLPLVKFFLSHMNGQILAQSESSIRGHLTCFEVRVDVANSILSG